MALRALPARWRQLREWSWAFDPLRIAVAVEAWRSIRQPALSRTRTRTRTCGRSIRQHCGVFVTDPDCGPQVVVAPLFWLGRCTLRQIPDRPRPPGFGLHAENLATNLMPLASL